MKKLLTLNSHTERRYAEQARAAYPDSKPAGLYDGITMPYGLPQAHRDNDRAVLEAYGISRAAA